MSIDLPLDQMSLAEKLEAMELLWADLSKEPEKLSPPEWHQEILQHRKELVEQGKLKFLDWETAFKELRKEIREDSAS